MKKYETNLDVSVLKQGPNTEVLKERGVFTRQHKTSAYAGVTLRV